MKYNAVIGILCLAIGLNISLGSCSDDSIEDIGNVPDTEEEGSLPTIKGHEYVDLGLPSGIKWATCNVGASCPSDYGHYFAWGETMAKAVYTEENSRTWMKDLHDISGDPQYDAARSNWGGSWRLPSEAECEELMTKCTWTLTEQRGHKGCKVTGPNGKSVFLPAAGWYEGASLRYAGDYGHCWSATPYESNAWTAYQLFFSGPYGIVWDCRYYGCTVRPVSE